MQGAALMFQYESYKDANGMCVTQSGTTTAVPIVDTGALNIPIAQVLTTAEKLLPVIPGPAGKIAAGVIGAVRFLTNYLPV